MKKNDLFRTGGAIFRVLETRGEMSLIMNCTKGTMPTWAEQDALDTSDKCPEEDLLKEAGVTIVPVEDLQAERRRIAYQRYTWIAGILPCIENESARSAAIQYAAEQHKVSPQTIRRVLCRYLAFQSVSALAPKEPKLRYLTTDEKNFRWALNRYFFTKHKNSLRTAYENMLKERYCDAEGILLPEYPAFHRFKYFYYKVRKMETYYISRNGMMDYKKNHRPLVGGTVQDYAGNVGMAFADSTVMDVFLVDDAGNLIGRPTLVCAIDVFSGLILGYAMTLESGVYSLRALMHCIVADKVQLCRKFGIIIEQKDWPNMGVLPGQIVTDNGSDYASQVFEQTAELGVEVINLPPWRADLKSSIEKTFDTLQNLMKSVLAGNGGIDVDFAERGAVDYRTEACLTMRQLETMVLHTILFLNGKHILRNYPFTKEMLQAGVKPYPIHIWKYGLGQVGCNLIPVSEKQLQLTLLPRTGATFTRYGLTVNRLRYHREGFKEQYLKGGKAVVAYNPDDVSAVWLIQKGGEYLKFDLIEARFKGKTLSDTTSMQQQQKELNRSEAETELQAKLELTRHLESIVAQASDAGDISIKDVRKNRKRARTMAHRDYMKEIQDE